MPNLSREEPGLALAASSAATDEPQGGPYAWYVVGVLILAYTLSFIDRQALTLLVGPIRETLEISDTQLSLLHGFAFALFYTVMGIPIGRMIDRRRRTTIIAAGIVTWSLMTAFCGLARNFTQMFLARIGVGIGEAALSPGAYSLIGDYFPVRQRTQALSIYIGAAYIGSGLAIMIGGALISLMPPVDVPLVGRLESWQGVFVAIGLPGVLVALIMLSVREPRRTGVKQGMEPAFGEVLAHMRRNASAYVPLILGFSLSGLTWNGALAWLPTFFMRTFGWTAAEVGFRYGSVIIASGVLGSIAGGTLAARMRSGGRPDANVVIGLISLAIATPAGIAGSLSGDGSVALACVFLFLFGCAMPYGGAAAALQDITPNQLRGQVSAVYLFSLSLVGMGFGPTLVALITDTVFANDAAVGKSLAIMIAVSAPASALVLMRARAPYRRALATVDF